AAARMGLPVGRLVVATNRNDILARFFATGEYRVGEVRPTMSPSMDIQVSSNFERLLFEMSGRDAGAVCASMDALAREGGFRVGDNQLAAVRELFAAARVDEAECAAAIGETWRQTGWLPDPHTAVGLAAARQCRGAAAMPMVTLATAHPAKFPDAVERASGIRPALPARLADLYDRPERMQRLPGELAAVQSHIEAHARLARERSGR
ncbi:MAG: threonine synthase, partial [Alphaproteobacteria bacterium]|nr:threonine synthase [Alphaproteobacteria bacterium]